MNYLVSVIIPAYNTGEVIRETIGSVIAQTYSNFEIIIIDDGSNDNTQEIIKSINDNRIKYYYQKNSGLPAQVRNAGVKFSKGELIAFLDHDDAWMPEKLQAQIEVIKNNPDIALVSANAFFMYDKEKTKKLLITGVKSGYFKANVFIPLSRVIPSTILVKKSSFDKVGGFNEAPDLFAAEDYDFWLRIYSQFLCYYINAPLMYYREKTGSASGKESEMLKRALHHYNKYFSAYGFPKKINQARRFEMLAALYARKIFLRDKECAECLAAQKLSIGTLFAFILWAAFSLPFKSKKIYELFFKRK